MKTQHDLSDDDIRRAFESYTLLALDLAMQLDDQALQPGQQLSAIEHQD